MHRPTLARPLAVTALAALSLVGCSHQRAESNPHAGHDMDAAVSTASAAGLARSASLALPAGATDVAARLASSPRHGEWVMIRTGPTDSVKAWVVYPERATKSPVVLVVHEIYGLSTWIRGVADQLAADGFIAVAPDLLTGTAAPAPGADTLTQAAASAAIRLLKPEDVQRQLAAVGRYAMALPAAEKKYGVVGFCWGGSTSFATAVTSPAGQGASVVYYGSSPAIASLASVKIPVLGLYAGDDARVNATVPPVPATASCASKTERRAPTSRPPCKPGR
jgi:carboxymethylenebutenolidase